MGGAWAIWAKGPYEIEGFKDERRCVRRLNTFGTDAQSPVYHLEEEPVVNSGRSRLGGSQGKYVASRPDITTGRLSKYSAIPIFPLRCRGWAIHVAVSG